MPAAALALLLVVRMYDVAGVNPDNVERARRLATAALGGAGIQTRWVSCAPSRMQLLDQPEECAGTLRGATIMIRLVEKANATGYGDVLGDAYVDTAAGAGSLATVFVAHIERLAADAGINVGTLLGLTMAHEIGHLLLGTASHEPRGLMRATWSPAWLRRQSGQEWSFSASDRVRLATGVARRGEP